MAQVDLVLSGGGTKGVAFIGALGVLEEHKHTIGRTVGTSAGAVMAALIASGYTAQQMRDKLFQDAADPKEFLFTFLAPPSVQEVRKAMQQPDSQARKLIRSSVEQAVNKSMALLGDKAPAAKIPLQIAVGLVKSELYDVAYDAFITSMPDEFPLVPWMWSFVEYGGFFSTERFEAWLGGHIRGKWPRFDNDWTFRRWHRETGRDLSIVTADTTDLQALVLNHRTAPDCPVLQAVRMSMSIPLIWQEVIWQQDWGTYMGQKKTGNRMVDGGAMLNFPIRYLLVQNQDIQRIMGQPPAQHVTVGMLLDDTLRVVGDMDKPEPEMNPMLERISRLIDTVTRWEDELIRQYDAAICRIPTRGYEALEFLASTERLAVLINSGADAMTAYLKRRRLE
ncbi:MAG: patatin-like phospholipase family protein [Gemmataceae bacterium]